MAAPAKKDPRFRPYRVLMYGAYLAVVSTFSMLVIVSVVRSVYAVSPGIPPLEGQALGVKQCLGQANTLWHQLETRRRAFSDADAGRTLERDFERFRVDWLHSLRQAESRCAVESPERKKVGRVFHALERVEDLYTTSAVQYSGEVAPAVVKLRKALADPD